MAYFCFREEMRTFFAKSMTGIRRLVSDQYNKVKEDTGKPPKVSSVVSGDEPR